MAIGGLRSAKFVSLDAKLYLPFVRKECLKPSKGHSFDI